MRITTCACFVVPFLLGTLRAAPQQPKPFAVGTVLTGQSYQQFGHDHIETECYMAHAVRTETEEVSDGDCSEIDSARVYGFPGGYHAHFNNGTLQWVEYVVETKTKATYDSIVAQITKQYGKPDVSSGVSEDGTIAAVGWNHEHEHLSVNITPRKGYFKILVILEKSGSD